MRSELSVPPPGSSPRKRGTERPGRGDDDPGRFIPAQAGNRFAQYRAISWVAVHPRASGEQAALQIRPARSAGSSPRKRGTGESKPRGDPRLRFIPAQAGNSPGMMDPPSKPPVHPRASGEQLVRLAGAATSIGSSPRKRGTAGRGRGARAPERFIPAQAGNSPACAPAYTAPSVHPRASGEQASDRFSGSVIVGSSPRKRGTDMRQRDQRIAERFIPAQAGNRRPCARHRGAWPVHPRASGEQLRR